MKTYGGEVGIAHTSRGVDYRYVAHSAVHVSGAAGAMIEWLKNGIVHAFGAGIR